MWKALYCYLTGQHEYAVTCEPGHIFLRCRACGRESNGWGLNQRQVQRHAREQVVVPLRRTPSREARTITERHAA